MSGGVDSSVVAKLLAGQVPIEPSSAIQTIAYKINEGL
jgi:asparagine synthetase B (glutamine-hydrolysing)